MNDEMFQWKAGTDTNTETSASKVRMTVNGIGKERHGSIALIRSSNYAARIVVGNCVEYQDDGFAARSNFGSRQSRHSSEDQARQRWIFLVSFRAASNSETEEVSFG